MRARPWFLYLLECEDGSVYAGITVDVAARYAAHSAGKGARYTRSHRPLRVLAAIDYPDRACASRAEYEVRTLSACEKRAYALMITLADESLGGEGPGVRGEGLASHDSTRTAAR